MELKTIEEINAYFEGKISGVISYAWWKGGTQYVGTVGMPLSRAKLLLMERRDSALKSLSEGKKIFSR